MIEVFVMNSNMGGAKNPIKPNGWNHHMKDKRKGQKTCSPQEPKKEES